MAFQPLPDGGPAGPSPMFISSNGRPSLRSELSPGVLGEGRGGALREVDQKLSPFTEDPVQEVRHGEDDMRTRNGREPFLLQPLRPQTRLTGTVAAWLALAVWCAPAFAQDTSPLHATLPQAASGVREAQPDGSLHAKGESNLWQLCVATLTSIPLALVLLPPPVGLPRPPAFAQDKRNPPEAKRSEKKRPISYGGEIGFSSGHADRGLVISDSPVVQPIAWVSGSITTFSAWGNITLAETTDRSRPQILELEL